MHRMRLQGESPSSQPRSSPSDSSIFSQYLFNSTRTIRPLAFSEPGGAPAVKHGPMTCFSFSLPHDARGDVNSATRSSKYTVRVRKRPSLEEVRRMRRQYSAKQGACRRRRAYAGHTPKARAASVQKKRGPIALFEQAQNDKSLHISVRGESRSSFPELDNSRLGRPLSWGGSVGSGSHVASQARVAPPPCGSRSVRRHNRERRVVVSETTMIEQLSRRRFSRVCRVLQEFKYLSRHSYQISVSLQSFLPQLIWTTTGPTHPSPTSIRAHRSPASAADRKQHCTRNPLIPSPVQHGRE